LVLNEAINAYLELSGSAAMPTSCRNLQIPHSLPHIYYYRGSEDIVPSN